MTTISQKIQAQLTADLALNAQDIAALRDALEEAHEQVVNAMLAHTVASDAAQAAIRKESEIERRLNGQRALRETLKHAAMQALQQHLVERAQYKGLPAAMATALYTLAHQASSNLTAIETAFDEAMQLVIDAYLAGSGERGILRMRGADLARLKTTYPDPS